MAGKPREDLSEKRFGRLIAREYVGAGKWLCTCDCGNVSEVRGSNLKTGQTRSCGCMKGRAISESKKKHGLRTRGRKVPRVYSTWRRIRSRRCKRPVCDEWLEFNNFYTWSTENGYTEEVASRLRMIDSNCGYYPENCYWSDKSTMVTDRRSHNARPVDMINDCGEVIQHFGSASIAASITGIAAKSIRDVCNGKYQSTHETMWRFSDTEAVHECVDDINIEAITAAIDANKKANYLQHDANEEWRDIEGYDGLYQISNFGNVRSKTSIMSCTDNGHGYMVVGLVKDGHRKNHYVHRLVADAFIPNPDGLATVDHIDFNRSNNVSTNLQWLSQADNNARSRNRQPELHGGTNEGS